ncbi:DUF2577 domain-containing protein [Alkaliphilus peptidifermentans]|uniref:DUF2577 domain-containing protein n=1 Tax=Alkaliphilus peptidifermentans DSM 18978 TaxID=1120976 RepID=A0A1G5JXU7_9FIRM|nr:DUF2577 domain-containing protein [Alkaliphilus peptidifermentans]SCY93195.1 Protein of unknown function [Alkaliphilus peptidifermentans DSM 18978]
MNLLNVIKTAGMQAVDSTNPVGIFYGTVVSTNPIKVNVDQRFTLTSEFIVMPESLTGYEIDLAHTHQCSNGSTAAALNKIIVRSGLKEGDKVILLRLQGGQKYLILDKEAAI